MDKSDNIIDVKLPPLRGLNDFALDSARFQMPNINDLEKWNNRVVNNMLYYQTNYFVLYSIIFAIVAYVCSLISFISMSNNPLIF